MVCSVDCWRTGVLLSGTWLVPKQMCVCMLEMHVSLHTQSHVSDRVAAKCHCVSAKTNRLNEKQLLGQRARKWERDGGGAARTKHTAPLSPTRGLQGHTVPLCPVA